MPNFCSWSGGKESTLALDRVQKQNQKVKYLITMFPRKNSNLGHGLPQEFYKLQAESLGMELLGKETTWEDYEKNFSNLIRKIEPEKGIFGDVYVEDHFDWVERKGKELGFEPLEPLAGEKPEELFIEFLEKEYEAIIVKIDPTKISEEWLGKSLSKNFLEHVRDKEVCPIGENGEYHTATIDGPIFQKRIEIEVKRKREYGEKKIIELEDFRLSQ